MNFRVRMFVKSTVSNSDIRLLRLGLTLDTLIIRQQLRQEQGRPFLGEYKTQRRVHLPFKYNYQILGSM